MLILPLVTEVTEQEKELLRGKDSSVFKTDKCASIRHCQSFSRTFLFHRGREIFCLYLDKWSCLLLVGHHTVGLIYHLDNDVISNTTEL